MSNKFEFKEDSLFDDDGISLFSLSDTVLSACFGCAKSYRKSLKFETLLRGDVIIHWE